MNAIISRHDDNASLMEEIPQSEIEVKPVNKWEYSHIEMWLQKIDMQENAIFFSNYNGSMLLQITHEVQLEQLGIGNILHRRFLYQAISSLQRHLIFSQSEFNVVQKLLKREEEIGRREKSDIFQYAYVLSNPKEFQSEMLPIEKVCTILLGFDFKGIFCENIARETSDYRYCTR